jgi:hypothetical protein
MIDLALSHDCQSRLNDRRLQRHFEDGLGHLDWRAIHRASHLQRCQQCGSQLDR